MRERRKMMERGIWLLRHGDIVRGGQRRFVGQRDLPLSGVGHRQYARLAEVMAEKLAKTPPKAFFCSDLSRGIECADMLRRAFRPAGGKMPVIADRGLREISLGAWEGLTKEEVEKRYPGALDERMADLAGYAPAGGESFEMVQRRAIMALARFRMNYPDGILVVVGHAGLNRAILADYMALPLRDVLRIPQEYACSVFLENR